MIEGLYIRSLPFIYPPACWLMCISLFLNRVNWSGSALNTFYAAIRKALVVVVVARALGVLFGVSFALWWIFS